MSLEVKVLNELNTTQPQEVDEFEFFSGEDRTIKLQIFDEPSNNDYLIALSSTVNIVLRKKDNTELSKAATIDTVHRSIITASLTAAETALLISGNIIVTIADGGSTRIARGINKIKLLSKVKPF